MDLRKLEIFVAVAREQSFRKASEKLHMAQPAVSIAVKKLEDEFGLSLLSREGRAISLTPEGEVALVQATNLLAQARHLKQTLHDYTNLLRGEVNVACPSMVATYFLPDVLTSFLTEFPGITANIQQQGTQKIEQDILRGQTELGVVTSNLSSSALTGIKLLSDRVVFCVANGHKYENAESIAAHQLVDEPLVVYETDYYIRRQFDKYCSEGGVLPNIKVETNFLPLIVNSVKKRLGSTVGLELMSKRETGISGIRLAPEIPVDIYLAWDKRRILSRANQCFVDWLTDRFAQSQNRV